MTEAQLIRLNELARKVWPRAVIIYRICPTNRAESGSVSVATDVGDEGTATERVFFAAHPLALDALEAALRVMAGEP